MSEDKIDFNENIDVNLRPKRQITLPQKVCEKLGLEYGDKLELRIKENYIIIRPKKTLALNALSEIRNAFQRSGINEEELLKSQEEIRHGRQKKNKDFS